MRPSMISELKCHCQPRALIDSAAGIQLGGDVRTPNQMHGFSHLQQRLLQFASGFLSGADNHRIHR